VADEVRDKLARKIQERERKTEVLIKQPTNASSTAEADEREAGMLLPVVLIWTAAFVVGIATGSVPLGLGALVVGHILLQAFAAVRRAASSN
jgi:cytochrome c biogenesis protein CcdA